MDHLVCILQFLKPNDIRNLLRVNKNFNSMIEKNWWPLCDLLGYKRIPLYIGSVEQPLEYQYDRDKYLYFSYTNKLNKECLITQVATWVKKATGTIFSGTWYYDPVSTNFIGSNLMTIRHHQNKKHHYKFVTDEQVDGYFELHSCDEIFKGYYSDNLLDGVIEFIKNGYISEYTYSEGVREGPYKKVGCKNNGQVYSETGIYQDNKKIDWHQRHYQNKDVDRRYYQDGVLTQKISTRINGDQSEYKCFKGKVRSGCTTSPNGDRRVSFYDLKGFTEAYAEIYIYKLNYTFRGDWTTLKIDKTRYYLLESKHPLYSKWRQYMLSQPKYEPIYYLV